MKLRNYIGGAFEDPATGEYLPVVEPATGVVFAQVARSGAADVEAAVNKAREAFPGWSSTPREARSRYLLRLAELIEARIDALAEAESKDNGKPLALARRVDIPRAAANFRFFATAILHNETEAFQTDAAALNVTLRSPRGVAGLISPWNLPLYLLSWKIAPALASGNTAVAKPSELTPLTAFMLSELCSEIGLPDGVLNIVHGLGAEVGEALVAHPHVPAISFTGGTATGQRIASAVAPMFKKTALEMGGKNATIIFDDVALADVIPQVVRSAYSNQGQICLCGSRILVQRPIFEQFVERFTAAVRALRVGDPLDSATDQGAVVSEAHLQKIERAVERARGEGGEVLCGGSRHVDLPERCRNGFFYQPTVITGLGPHCATNQEEIFGPVATVMPFDDEAEAVRDANCTPYGLSASVWTTNLGRAHRVASALEAGTVWVNCWMLRDLRTPFGGMKQSGMGREGGEEALRFFTEPKTVCFAIEER